MPLCSRINERDGPNQNSPIFAIREGYVKVIARAIALLLIIVLPALAADGVAQTTRIIQGSPFQPDPNLSDRQKRGQHWFLQRCALCHLPKYTKEKTKVELPVFWMSLVGLFRDARPDQEQRVREIIRKGARRMPGFQYGLKPSEIEDLIAYLKTL